MTRRFDRVVIGGSADGLVAATVLARSGRSVLLVEARPDLGGTLREIEFLPGFRAAPLAADLGHVDGRVLRAIGAERPAAIAPDPAVVALGEGAPLVLRRGLADTVEELGRHSPQDAAAWPAFCARLHALAGLLAELYRELPPRINAGGLRELISMLRLGRRYRGLDRDGMIDWLRILPMPLADLLDERFASGRLKGALAAIGVADLCRGPLSGGTALHFIHRHVGLAPGVVGDRLQLASGAGALIAALAARARANGVAIEVGAEVTRLIVRDDRVTGLLLGSGEELRCDAVISGADPGRTLLTLLDPVHLDPEFIAALRNVRYRGVSSFVLLALEALPAIPGIERTPAGPLFIAPSVRYIERAYDASKYGRCSEEPVIELRFPSVAQGHLAPAGRHVAVLRVQYTPYRLRDDDWSRLRTRIAERAIALVESHVPGLAARIGRYTVLTPADLEEQFGIREGAVSRGEFALDQIAFMRPVPAASRYATPVDGLYLCGAGTHPGYGMTGLSGLLAARVADRR